MRRNNLIGDLIAINDRTKTTSELTPSVVLRRTSFHRRRNLLVSFFLVTRVANYAATGKLSRVQQNSVRSLHVRCMITGLEIKFLPVSSRTAAVDAMNSGQLELALTGPSEYLVMHQLSKADVIVGWQRPDYSLKSSRSPAGASIWSKISRERRSPLVLLPAPHPLILGRRRRWPTKA